LQQWLRETGSSAAAVHELVQGNSTRSGHVQHNSSRGTVPWPSTIHQPLPAACREAHSLQKAGVGLVGHLLLYPATDSAPFARACRPRVLLWLDVCPLSITLPPDCT
jgi:hypothetical protein